MVASLVLVHTDSYEPAVSYILYYLVSSVGIITAAVVVPLLPAEQFSAGMCGSVYALYAAVVAMMVFFSGGVSSELYVMFFPLLLGSALHGSWRVMLGVLTAVLFCYALAMLPGLLEQGTDQDFASLVSRASSSSTLPGPCCRPATLWRTRRRTAPSCSKRSRKSSWHAKAFRWA